MTGQHLEGCLSWLAENTPGFPPSLLGKPFGALVKELERLGALPSPLAKQLLDFNSFANVPARHMKAMPLNSELDKRTFSLLDASLAFTMMRKLSMEMFDNLGRRGVTIPQGWRDFDEDWLLWNRLV
jgi:hypothetical protein